MKTLNTISFLLVLVAACTVLSSCSLLVASPIHSPRQHFPTLDAPRPHHHGDYMTAETAMGNSRAYQGFISIPAKGGIFEFECATDHFFISKILDSSMPRRKPHTHSNCRCPYTADDYILVDDTNYYGSFYTISCNYDKQSWTIEVDPLTASYSGFMNRDIWVIMWKEGDEVDRELYSLHFRQGSIE